MNFLFADKTVSGKARLDGSKLPKYYRIPAHIYEILMQNNTISVILPTQNSTKQYDAISKKVESLIFELLYAAKGYKDCEMTPAKFHRLLSAFKNANDSPAINFNLNPNISVNIS